MTTTRRPPDDQQRTKTDVLADNADIGATAIGLTMAAAAITILASWPWALLAIGLALVALGTVVI